jgi:Protein of unknown function (DUF2505)
MSYTVSHTINTDVDGLWRLFFDQEVARAMIKEFGNVGNFEVVEERVDELGLKHRRIECWSNVELPSFAKKLVGDGAYTEIGCFDAERKKYTAQCVPKHGADKFKTSFEVTALPLGDGSTCERQITTENTVKLFGLGGMIESLLERTQREAHAQSAKFLNDWIRSNLRA